MITDPSAAAVALAALLEQAAGQVAVLTGAGMSTDSGIPDYRGVTGRARPTSPMTYQEFIATPDAQQRYWARSHLGWRTINHAGPNPGHLAVGALQRSGTIGGVITQNVDGLHQAGGATDVVELHGALDRVICLDCGTRSRRMDLEARLDQANPYLRDHLEQDTSRVRPDGDVALATDLVSRFQVVACEVCGGRLKPDVVFFGESVPKPRVAQAFSMVEESRALLVLGSSLTVMSGYRFVRRAHRLGIPIAIVNQGVTRGDAEATLRIDLGITELLQRVAGSYVR